MRTAIVLCLGLCIVSTAAAIAQRGRAASSLRDPIAILNARIQSGELQLKSSGPSGYLTSVLAALNVPLESQVAVFSQTSFQASLVSPENPRAIYFNDAVAVGWVRGSGILEAAAYDPSHGMLFYTLDQASPTAPKFEPRQQCLSCHVSSDTLGVPGLMVRSTHQATTGNFSPEGVASDHRTALDQRWGGWYVTGLSRQWRHQGNRIGQGWLKSLYDQFYTEGYPTLYSDIVALMVLEHQTRMTNFIARVASESDSPSGAEGPPPGLVNDLVDYMLFIDEAPLPSRIIGTSGYTEVFARLDPQDRQGHSLREFDLETRLFRYPCSYMIYSTAFDALPRSAKTAIYARLWEVLSGTDHNERYARISPGDRQVIVQILRDTKSDLPSYFNHN